MKITESALRKYIRERVRLLETTTVNPVTGVPVISTTPYTISVGGMAGASAVIMAIEAAFPNTYDFKPAGVGSRKDDLLVTPKAGGDTISIEVKYGATMSRPARFDISSGAGVAGKIKDLLVFAVGSGGNITFIIAHMTTDGQTFASKVFGITTQKFNPKSGTITYSGKRTYVNLNGNQMKNAGRGTSVASTISEGEAHMEAFAAYCKTSAHNIKMAGLLAPLIGKADGNEVIALQCKFDSDFSSCLTSIHRKRDDRWLPVIPDWTKAGGKYSAFKQYFINNQSNFTNNETNAVVHDYSGATPKPPDGTKNVTPPDGDLNQDIADAFDLTLQAVDAIIDGTNTPSGFNELMDNLTKTGRIGVDAVDAFVAAGDINYLIALIQAGIKQSLITEAAARSILKKYNEAENAKLKTTGKLKTLYSRINNITINPNKSLNVTKPNVDTVKKLPVAQALAAINAYRISKKWRPIRDDAALMAVVASETEFNGRDVSNALRFSLAKRNELFENAKLSISDLLGNSAPEDLPDDFMSRTGIQFSVLYDENALIEVAEILDESGVNLFDFIKELKDTIEDAHDSGEDILSDEIYATNIPTLDYKFTDQFKTKNDIDSAPDQFKQSTGKPNNYLSKSNKYLSKPNKYLSTPTIPSSYQDDDPQEIQQTIEEIRQKMVRRLIREVLRKKLK